MSKFLKLRYAMESAVQSGSVQRIAESLNLKPVSHPEQQANRLTAAALAMSSIKRFYEGFFGTETLGKAMAEGRALRLSNPALYAETMRQADTALTDLTPIRAERAILEAMTTSDLAYGIYTLRGALQRNLIPPFQSDLFALAGTPRIVDDFLPIRSAYGVQLADRFLKQRAEGTNVQYTGWLGVNDSYTVSNLELALGITWEALKGDRFNEFQDAMFQLGVNAARTRAWVLLDAIRRLATRVPLPDSAFGPTIGNIEAVQAFLANQTYLGANVSRSITDLYVPNKWKILTQTTINTPNVAYTGGQTGPLAQASPVNPVYQIGAVHAEQIITEAGIDPNWPAGSSIGDWIAADRTAVPLEMAVMSGFEGGARTLTRIAETVEFDFGSFENHIFEVKVSDVVGATVPNKSAVVVVAGS
ncbi:hypothetical protein GCM10022631_11280 [Deinococcus rubellus]|uniref:phage major capsid protein n=1 Tax=Deinococcus rubellus TaxID=1889240 RepID=UPI0031EDB148